MLHKFTISRKDRLLIYRAVKYVIPYKWMFTIASFSLLLNISLGLLHPFFTARIVTSIFSNDFSKILSNTYFLASVMTASLLINWFQSYINKKLNENIVFDIKRDMYYKIIHLPVQAFDRMPVGEFISRLNGDASTIAYIITQQLVNIIIDILKVIIIGFIIFKICSYLSFAITAIIPLSYFVFFLNGKIIRKKTDALVKEQDSYYSNIQETISAIKEVKCLGIEEKRIQIFLSSALNIKKMNINIGLTSSGFQSCAGLLNVISEIIVILYGYFLTTIKKLTIENYVAYMFYYHQFIESILNITRINSSLQHALVSLQRIFELMDNLTFKQDTYGNYEAKSLKGDISFRNISFCYDPDREILNNISFDIQSGSTTVIVGHSGSGKSTIFNLILRFYRSTQGDIFIDGINIKKYTDNSLRKSISVVRQEPVLFKMTIKENIKLSNSDASDNEIEWACKQAYVHNDIMKTEKQYDTIIIENGANLSIGQKQRIAIARALLNKSQIILFDEPTSALDIESQYYIAKTIKKLAKTKTILIITHQLSSILDSDLIIFISNGKIKGYGKHSELISKNMFYRQLYNKKNELVKSLK